MPPRTMPGEIHARYPGTVVSSATSCTGRIVGCHAKPELCRMRKGGRGVRSSEICAINEGRSPHRRHNEGEHLEKRERVECGRPADKDVLREDASGRRQSDKPGTTAVTLRHNVPSLKLRERRPGGRSWRWSAGARGSGSAFCRPFVYRCRGKAPPGSFPTQQTWRRGAGAARRTLLYRVREG